MITSDFARHPVYCFVIFFQGLYDYFFLQRLVHSVTVLVSLKGTALLNIAKAQVCFNYLLAVYQKLSGYVT